MIRSFCISKEELRRTSLRLVEVLNEMMVVSVKRYDVASTNVCNSPKQNIVNNAVGEVEDHMAMEIRRVSLSLGGLRRIRGRMDGV